MLNKLRQLYKARDLRNDILFVFAIILIFRLISHIPVPGVSAEGLKNFLQGNQLLGMLNIFTGGGLQNFSIVMLGLGPYITASIIFQLLTMIVPRLEELSKEGEQGMQKINQWTRMVAVPLAILQAYATLIFLSKNSSAGQSIISSFTPMQLVTAIISITGGSIFLMWLGELISERKVGNGISILIFAGIISALPQTVVQGWFDFTTDPGAFTKYLIFIIVALVTIAAVVIITEGQRNIPVSYARRLRGGRQYGGAETHLPLRVNQAGVIPIIFAISILLFPPLLAQFFAGAKTAFVATAANFTINIFQQPVFRGVLYFLLVVIFTYFYTAIIFHPDQIAENLQKQGGFVPGIRPGRETAVYLGRVMNRIILAGALFLGLIAILPTLLQKAGGFNLVIGGTSLLIVVAVVIETVKQIESQLVMRDYEGGF